MAKAKPFTIGEADVALQDALLTAAAAKNEERQKRQEAKSRMHQAVKALAEAQRALSAPEELWSGDDWKRSAEHAQAAAALLKA